MICKGEPPQLVDDEDELPQLIASMLVKDPTKRSTMRELRDMYKDIFEHHEENWEKHRRHFEKRREETLKMPDAKHLTRTVTEVCFFFSQNIFFSVTTTTTTTTTTHRYRP